MRKLIALLMVFVGITSGAMAAGLANESKCIETYNFEETDASDIFLFARVFFKTGENVVSADCKKEIQAKFGFDDDYLKNIARFVFIGSADQQGQDKDYDNDSLSKRRAKYVQELINLPEGVQSDVYVTGDVNAEQFNRKKANLEDRSVSVYIIWKLSACRENTINKVNELEQQVKDMNGGAAKQMQSKIKEIKKICNTGGKSLTSSESERYAQLLAELADLAAQSGLGSDLQILYISDYLHELDMKETVWRNKEGKFNTARLASDSIAAVVLGTAGGLITSKVVKKNQVKSGFEDISCTIGGQKVADWHDEFTVGIQ